MEVLIEPWRQGIMQRALLEVALIGVVGGALGCWVVLARLSYGAESLAHGMLPGLVVASLVGAPLLLGGAAGIVVAALAVALVGRGGRRGPGELLGRDTAIAVVVTALFGLGALLALAPASPAGVQGLLFGDVLGTTTADLLVTAALAVAVTAALALLHWRLLAVGFDRGAAPSLGVPPAVADGALLVLLAVAVVVAVQALGNLLVVAVLVAPAAAARALTRRMGPMIATAVAIAVAAGIAGLYLSYYARIAAGAAVAGALVAAYLLARAAALMRPRS